MSDTLTMRTARQRVHDYKSESDELIARHSDEFELRNCEALLQLGIDAFHWLIRADAENRVASATEPSDFDGQLDDGLQALCRMWLVPCDFAMKRVAVQHERGYTVANLATFRECVDEMLAIVKFHEHPADVFPGGLLDLRNRAIQEFRDGQTAEFI